MKARLSEKVCRRSYGAVDEAFGGLSVQEDNDSDQGRFWEAIK